MRVALTVAGLFVLTLFAGCEGDRQPGPPVSLKSIVLHDVQGLFGGHALWATNDRTAIVQVVGHPLAGQSDLWEKRYKARLTAEQWTEVERLVGAHHFLTIKLPDRQGIPDEAHPIIAVVPKSGTTAKTRKWANDKHADFDAVYSYLLVLCRAEGELVYEGAFDWEWRPEGFEQPW
jgi:hypothetical protein